MSGTAEFLTSITFGTNAGDVADQIAALESALAELDGVQTDATGAATAQSSALDELGASADAAASSQDALAASTASSAGALDAGTGSLEAHNAALAENAGASDSAAASQDLLAGSLVGASTAASGTSGTYEDLNGQLRNADGTFASSAASADGAAASQDALAASTTAGAAATKEGSSALSDFSKWGALAFIGAIAGSGKLGEDFSKNTATLAGNADITIGKANAIGNAMLGMGSTVEYSGNQQIAAYAGVAGQLGEVEGHALSTTQAMAEDKAAMDLATGSGNSLTDSMGDLATVQQAFGIGAKGSAAAATVLYNTARLTGTGIDGVTTSAQRLHSQLGALTPSLGDTGAMIVDLTSHGETGRQAISAMNSATTSMLKPLVDQQTASTAAKAAADALPPSLRALANEYMNGTITSTAYANAVKALPTSQADLMATFTSAQTKLASANQTLAALPVHLENAKGGFVGWKDVIAQLQPQLEGMNQTQQMAALTQVFGAGASRKLLDVVLAGPEAYNKASAAVTDHAAMLKAVAEQEATVHGQMEKAKAGAADMSTQMGLQVDPKLAELLKGVGDGLTFLETHKGVLDAVEISAVAIGGALTAAFAVRKISSFISKMSEMGSSLKGFGSKVSGGRLFGGSGAAEDEAAATDEEGGLAGSTALDAPAATMQEAGDTMLEAATRMAEGGMGQGLERGAEGDAEGAVEGEGGELGYGSRAGALGEAGDGTLYAGGAGGAGVAAESGMAGEAGMAAEGGAGIAAEGGGLLAGGGLMAAAGPAAIGLIGVQMYNQLGIEKDASKVVGKNAASALGDMGAGAAAGAAVGSVVPVIGTAVGAAIGAVGGLIFAERKHIAPALEHAGKDVAGWGKDAGLNAGRWGEAAGRDATRLGKDTINIVTAPERIAAHGIVDTAHFASRMGSDVVGDASKVAQGTEHVADDVKRGVTSGLHDLGSLFGFGGGGGNKAKPSKDDHELSQAAHELSSALGTVKTLGDKAKSGVHDGVQTSMGSELPRFTHALASIRIPDPHVTVEFKPQGDIANVLWQLLRPEISQNTTRNGGIGMGLK